MERARQLLPRLNILFTFLSLACALTTLSMIGLGRQFAKRGEMNRVSIRLAHGVSVVILLKSSVLIVYIFSSNSGVVCTGLSFVVHWLSLLYVFFNVAISANLHSVALNGARPHHVREALCWTVPLMAATLLMGMPLGLDNDTLSCEFRDRQSLTTHIWIWSCFLIWIPISCAYCGVIVFRVLFGQGLAVAFDPEEYEKQSTDTNLCALISDLKILVSRIAYGLLYGEYNLFLMYCSVIGTGLAGPLTLLVFLMDPGFHGLIRSSQHKSCRGSGTDSNRKVCLDLTIPRFLDQSMASDEHQTLPLPPTPRSASNKTKSIMQWGNQIDYIRKSLPPLPCCKNIPPHPLTPNCQTCPDDIKLFIQDL